MDPHIHQAFIDNQGRLTVHDYMALSNKLYYKSHNPFGPEGDFVTAPEISPLFGEIIGLSLLDGWQRLGEPETFDLIELGPGRGHLMQDILRITQKYPKFHGALCLKFVDVNPRFTFPYTHQFYSCFKDALGHKPVFVVANEFFDALPIHQYLGQISLATERHVILQHDGLHFSYDQEADIIETCPQATDIFQQLVQAIENHGGLALIVDYGHNQNDPRGSTLQAVKKHRHTCPLANPGNQDLTAHVNFNPLISCIENKLDYDFDTQRGFLLKRGILFRMRQIFTSNSFESVSKYELGFHRLTDPHGMGTLFKTLWLEKKC